MLDHRTRREIVQERAFDSDQIVYQYRRSFGEDDVVPLYPVPVAGAKQRTWPSGTGRNVAPPSRSLLERIAGRVGKP